MNPAELPEKAGNERTEGCSDRELIGRFKSYFRSHAPALPTLSAIVKDLLRLGYDRQTLLIWGLECGCSQPYTRGVLSKVFCAIGYRQRKPGGGRKPSREVLEILAAARQRYGKRYLKLLRAAWREGQAQEKALALRAQTDACTAIGAAENASVGPDTCPAKALIMGP